MRTGGSGVSSLKRTVLHPLYVEYGAKLVDFGGWEMPVQFDSILKEHEAVRGAAGLFDVSHMGEFEVVGREARSFLQSMVTNDLSRLVPGRAVYSPMLYEHGGTVDDLLVYCLTDERYLLVVNAANIDKDYAWLSEHATGYAVSVRNRSDECALLALQGPRAASILQRLTSVSLAAVRPYRFVMGEVDGVQALVSRTGYTGEDGFEIYVPPESAPTLWRRLLAVGEADGLLPCGLGARDTLRLEAALPLYGHELDTDITPLEAGLHRFVKFDKGDFIGRASLITQQETGPARELVGLRLLHRGVPRAGQAIVALSHGCTAREGTCIGRVTSGTHSPTLHQGIALALVDAGCVKIGSQVGIDIRGRATVAEVVKIPFYRRAR
ncbi:glycine cleavage system aminomethyltransferase GcvT [Alicyclobacillus shizuokensis]|uniref:glycine cleavage system aminomethyltransferase GcvT n=1 Tax=Alicyclobacillus shizuokensis TaxID=392014 RepID=UPI0009F8EBA5|nr:glycine cleavage system aminomethyltransferase GcvT [Alicyclobacillus shizuokensis]MCL6625158.1 glycine cleavage system aminomethyltransferase GcvT [Alicyclobacillus shizuokensis]